MCEWVFENRPAFETCCWFRGVDARFGSITFFLRAKSSPITIVWYDSNDSEEMCVRVVCERWIKCNSSKARQTCESCTHAVVLDWVQLFAFPRSLALFLCVFVCLCVFAHMCVNIYPFVLNHHGLYVCVYAGIFFNWNLTCTHINRPKGPKNCNSKRFLSSLVRSFVHSHNSTNAYYKLTHTNAYRRTHTHSCWAEQNGIYPISLFLCSDNRSLRIFPIHSFVGSFVLSFFLSLYRYHSRLDVCRTIRSLYFCFSQMIYPFVSKYYECV